MFNILTEEFKNLVVEKLDRSISIVRGENNSVYVLRIPTGTKVRYCLKVFNKQGEEVLTTNLLNGAELVVKEVKKYL